MATLDYINELPDVYAKEAGGAFQDKNGEDFQDASGVIFCYSGCNNWKLLSLEGSLIIAFQGDIEAAVQSLDIYSAKGKTLDLYGKMLGQYRNGVSDEQYRYLILGKINGNFCNGSYNSIVEQLAIIFGCDSSEFSFIETDDCSVTLESLPMKIMLEASMTPEQMVGIIKSLLPSGVKLEKFELSGSFMFGGVDEYDETAGFADEAQTIGGYLGAMAGV